MECPEAIWTSLASQPASFFEQAVIDSDGKFVETNGECKQGVDTSYKGLWTYHPLAVTLANTGEVLRLVSAPGNRPSHEGAATQIDGSIAMCRAAGFRSVRIRGDTDFTQTQHLDRWHDQGEILLWAGCHRPAPHPGRRSPGIGL